MSMPKNIQDKFAGFEPEVDDLHIHQEWEKVKYFIPQKKKRRGGIFFIAFGLAATTGLTALLLTSFFGVKNQREGITETSGKQEAANNEQEFARSVAGNTTQAIAAKTLSDIKKDAGVTNSQEQHYDFGVNDVSRSALNHLNQQKDPLNSLTQEDKADSGNREDKFLLSPENERVSGKSNLPDVDTRYTLFALQSDVLKSRFLFLNDTGHGVDELKKTYGDSLFISKMRPDKRFFVELYSGVGSLVSEVAFSSENGTIKNNALIATAGIGSGYKLTHRLNVLLQLNVTSPGLIYEETNVFNKEVYRKKQVALSSVGIDTIGYVKVHSRSVLKGGVVYHAGLGFVYQVAAWKRISLGLSGGLMLGWQTLKNQQIYASGSDTLVYITSVPNESLPDKIPAGSFSGVEENRKRLGQVSTVIGLDVSYRLHNRFQLVLKPQYYLDLTQRTAGKGEQFYLSRQNNLFLGIGGRLFF